MEKIVWHFATNVLRDGSPLPDGGDILPHIADPVPCERGWHGSERIIDALRYAPGCMLAQRMLTGIVTAHGDPIDKYAASDGYMLTPYVDVSDVIVALSRYCALAALREYAAPALRAAGLLQQAETLAALADDCDLAAARADAWEAANAARTAAGAAGAAGAANAARNAARAAWNAAGAANAARNAARAAGAANAARAAWNAAWAARAAAWEAAEAARDAQEKWLRTALAGAGYAPFI